jgi:multidrug resistance efflux pump
MVLAGFVGVLTETRYVSSSDAVVTAYVLNVKTPIDGTITGMPIASGILVQRDAPLAQVNNPLNDRQHLDNLQTAESAAQASAVALLLERGALLEQRKSLLNRADDYVVAITNRLNQETDETDRTLAALKLSFEEAAIELTRGEALHSAGILSNADYDKLVSAKRVLAEQVAAQQGAVANLRIQASAAAHGILAEPGTNNDVAYSDQRADELTTRLAEIDRMLNTSRAQAVEAHSEVAAEENRSLALAQTTLRAPIDGMIWRFGAVNGEHVSAGDAVVSLIDCNRQFLLVEVSQERLADIELGGAAHIRLTGENVERTGTVISASGDPQREIDHMLAAFPVQDPSRELATVVIGLVPTTGSDPGSCFIGRTARVRIPTRPSNFVSRWTRSVF